MATPLTARMLNLKLATMYCLQWLIPVLLIPKPLNPAMLHNHIMFVILYLVGFFLEKKPCTICSLVFFAAVLLICYSGIGNCLFWGTNCDSVVCDNG
ncbi:bladder cancer-associated protein-like isoform X2 [Amphibalanus amphitrite]|uniref:bladder cancer-associated protein-like isoform X2 n=1 Tax=Amphibalanus amphitrite TaxID=1232801 RepID=UPI001C9066E0|nr:bladder cancer-associated protein-like isoform X2 [Amphibalanus amphitrite]